MTQNNKSSLLKIKNVILLLILISSLSSCISSKFPLESKYERVYIGMTLDEFMNQHDDLRSEFMSPSISIYSIRYYDDRNAQAIVSSAADVTYKKFYYFENKVLTKVDLGERAVDFRIKID